VVSCTTNQADDSGEPVDSTSQNKYFRCCKFKN